MKHWFTVLVLLLPIALSAQTVKKQEAKKATAHPRAEPGAPDAALMQKIADAWCTLNPDNAARFYSKAPSNVFFDISPLKYTGWQEYAEGTQKMFADVKSLKLTAKDPQLHYAGNTAWATATWDGILEHNNGKKEVLNGRWTVVWEKQGGQWLIVHEHFSAPTP